ncbi:MAG: hypothetical protein IRZ14_12855 [Chloroflexi bacterium]|nr:hypothetical protein [Chloroflexota bacterium]
MRYRLAFALVATLVLFIVVTLPFSLLSVVDDLLGSPDSRVYPVPLGTPSTAPAAREIHLHIAFTNIDEMQRLLTVRLSGHQVCSSACGPARQLVFFSLEADGERAEGLPPSFVLVLPARSETISQTFQLPIRGAPVRYPFDSYAIVFALHYQEEGPDGEFRPVAPAEASQQLFLTVQEKLPRLVMEEPDFQRLDQPATANGATPYLLVMDVRFVRPLYLQVLTVALVLLVSAAAAYAVFMRPLSDLVIGSGALVLGVWGIRAIIVPSSQNYLTAVELSLASVILFLLLAITVRALWFVHDRAGLHLLPTSPPSGSQLSTTTASTPRRPTLRRERRAHRPPPRRRVRLTR